MERYSRLQEWPIERLKNLPPTTFGYRFAEHLNRHQLQLYPFPIERDYAPEIYLRERQREIHDILHALFDLGIDVPDEAELNSVLLAQAPAPISILIVAGSLFYGLFRNPKILPTLIQSIHRGFKRGLHMSPIFSVRWEEHFEKPFERVVHLVGAEIEDPTQPSDTSPTGAFR